MLVLSRKEGERIQIGEEITLVVSKISGNRVTIGIEAPKDVKVVRGELTSGSMDLSVPAASTTVRTVTLRDFAAAVLPLQKQVG